MRWEKKSKFMAYLDYHNASHSIINCRRFFMKWSALNYDRDLQSLIKNMQSALHNIKYVEIFLPPTIISCFFLGELMKAKELDQIVDKIALSKDSGKDPYLVLDAL